MRKADLVSRPEANNAAMREFSDGATRTLATAFGPKSSFAKAEQGAPRKGDTTSPWESRTRPIEQRFVPRADRDAGDSRADLGKLHFDPRDSTGHPLSAHDTVFEVRADRDSKNGLALRYKLVQGGAVDQTTAARMLRSMMAAAADISDQVGVEIELDTRLPGSDAFAKALAKLKHSDKTDSSTGQKYAEMSPYAIQHNLSRKAFEAPPQSSDVPDSYAADVTDNGRLKLTIKDDGRVAAGEGRSPWRGFGHNHPRTRASIIGFGGLLALAGVASRVLPDNSPGVGPDSSLYTPDAPIFGDGSSSGNAIDSATDAFDEAYGTSITDPITVVDPTTGDTLVVTTTAPELTTTTTTPDFDVDDNLLYDTNEVLKIRTDSIASAAVLGDPTRVWTERMVIDQNGQGRREVAIASAASATAADVVAYAPNDPSVTGTELTVKAPANVDAAVLDLFPKGAFDGTVTVTLDNGQVLGTRSPMGSLVDTVYVGDRQDITLTSEQVQALRGR
jgi:hypothetical protein